MLAELHLSVASALILITCGAMPFMVGYLALRTALLRVAVVGPPTNDPTKLPYSLGRCQMAYTYLILMFSYVLQFISNDWSDPASTAQVSSLPSWALAWLGISSVTAMASSALDNVASTRYFKLRAKLDRDGGPVVNTSATEQAERTLAEMILDVLPKPSLATRGFWLDLTVDGTGALSFARFQMVCWTVIFGVIFLAGTIRTGRMPVLNTSVLVLFGISAATYLPSK